MDDKKELNKDSWTKLSQKWAIGIPPWRPSLGEIAIYEDYLKKIIKERGENCRALIFGATPELRDLLAKYKIDTTLADVNQNMVKAMTELLEYSDGKEAVVVSNWLKIPIISDSFDVIMCDQGIQHILFEEWDDFFQETGRLLKKGGYFINSVVSMEESEALSVEQVVDAYKNHCILTREDNYVFLFRAMLNLNDVDGRKYCKNLLDYNEELSKFVEKMEITKNDFNFLKIPFGEFKVVIAPKEVVDEVTGRHFVIKSVRANFGPPNLSYYKIYFGEVKK